MQFSSFITNKIIKKLIEWDPELWWVDILHNIYFIEHGTENPCHTFRVDDVTFYIIIK